MIKLKKGVTSKNHQENKKLSHLLFNMKT